MAKNNPTKKQIDVEIQATLKHRPASKLTEKWKVYCYKIKDLKIFTWIISKVSVADFEHE